MLRPLFLLPALMISLAAADTFAAASASGSPVPILRTPPISVAPQMGEQQKIDALLDAMGKADVSLIRNGTSMTAADGKKYFEDRLREQQAQVHTAQDFIGRIASRPPENGKPYMIKFRDGSEMTATKWFQQKLMSMRGR